MGTTASTMRLSAPLCILLGQVIIAVGQFYLGPFLIQDTGILASFLPARRVDSNRPRPRPTARPDYQIRPITDYYGGDANHGLFKRSVLKDRYSEKMPQSG